MGCLVEGADRQDGVSCSPSLAIRVLAGLVVFERVRFRGGTIARSPLLNPVPQKIRDLIQKDQVLLSAKARRRLAEDGFSREEKMGSRAKT